MTLSPTMIREQRRQETGEVFVELLTLDHPSFNATVRLVRDNVSLTSNGNLYEPFAFSVVPPARTPQGEIPILRLAMQNVSQEVISLIRAISGTDPIKLNLMQVLRSEPNLIQREFPEMELRSVQCDALAITSEVVMSPILQQSIAADKFNPSKFPGIF